jgi:hypothetical protein
MTEGLKAELGPLSEEATPLATDQLGQAEVRFRRVVEAFRDRLGRNVQEATGVTIAPLSWEVKRPGLRVVVERTGAENASTRIHLGVADQRGQDLGACRPRGSVRSSCRDRAVKAMTGMCPPRPFGRNSERQRSRAQVKPRS